MALPWVIAQVLHHHLKTQANSGEQQTLEMVSIIQANIDEVHQSMKWEETKSIHGVSIIFSLQFQIITNKYKVSSIKIQIKQ